MSLGKERFFAGALHMREHVVACFGIGELIVGAGVVPHRGIEDIKNERNAGARLGMENHGVRGHVDIQEQSRVAMRKNV